tara:strand:+ start:43 stop:276 length:234 start_codon:yes stop_codon:yes gene_type:complete
MIKQGQHVFLTAKPGASQRTKNRIRERGDWGFRVQLDPRVPMFDGNRGTEWVLLLSSCGWNGWLPIDEVQIEQETKD